MRIEWLPVAAANRADQLDYVDERNPWAAIDLGDAIEAAIAYLTDQPMLGRPGRVAGTRELVIGKTPYILIYRIEDDVILIVRLLHGAQQWPPKT